MKITGEDSQVASKRYDRFVSELWYSAREWVKLGLVKHANPSRTLQIQLEGRLYKLLVASGKIQVESKTDMKSRGLGSPDYGDAFCLLVHLVRMRSGSGLPSLFPQGKRHDPMKRFKNKTFSFAADYGVKDRQED